MGPLVVNYYTKRKKIKAGMYGTCALGGNGYRKIHIERMFVEFSDTEQKFVRGLRRKDNSREMHQSASKTWRCEIDGHVCEALRQLRLNHKE